MFYLNQRVRVNPDLNPHQIRNGEWAVNFVKEMDKTVGQIGVIININNYGIVVDFDDKTLNTGDVYTKHWTFASQWLSEAKNEVDIMEED